MIQITIYQNHDVYTGFDSIGHAGYADAGDDIVCAGVSALVINTVNSIENFTEDEFHIDMEAESGAISLRFQGDTSSGSQLLIKSLVLGLQGIQNSYGNEYISIIFKEV